MSIIRNNQLIIQKLNSGISILIIIEEKKMTLVVKPISATINKGYDFFLIKRNPYLICTVGIEKQVTNAHLAGGKQPKWKDTLLFNARAPEMKVLLCDKAILREDNVLGCGNVSLTSIYSNPHRPQIQFVEIMKDEQSVAKVQMSIEYILPPSLSKENEIKLAVFKNQNQNKQDEQYRRVSGLLSDHLVSLVGNFSKSENGLRNNKIEQPNNRMAMSSVRYNNSPTIEERQFKGGHRKNNSLSNLHNPQYQQQKSLHYNHPIENNSHISLNEVLESETNPLKIIQKVSLNNMNNVMMNSMGPLRNRIQNFSEIQNKMRTNEQHRYNN